ncbi:MAG TPA: carbohydrate ABC transporter permease [Pseudonocardia sp.]|jgi:multiple sugar transport system permease protein|uniref:carbohydrate ABC transporter permease n=1 Tax=Pseudonocardia sp. TaxID=60912 RepID=UPI002B4AB13A|nr:carbohydrate ABC transporter permease [Pseudonocardia sp.]HLU55327.1 carbohydrate ABC transporter permease [Pseudonocardia sp.]
MATTTVAPVATAAAAPGPVGNNRRWYEGATAHVVLIALLLVALYPIVYMIGTSFKAPDEILNNVNVLPRRFSPQNYAEGWIGIPGVTFGTFFLNSAVVAAGVVIGNVVACSLAAFAFARLKFPLRGFWFAIMIGTLLLPHHVLIVPQYVLFNSLEWINTPLPLIVPKFLATEAFFVFLMVQFMRGIPRSLDEAAEIDGCGPYRRFLFVVLPLTKPALVTTAVFSFIWTWNDFFTQLVYLNDLDAYTVPIGLRLFLDSSGQNAIAPMFAMSVLSLVPVFLFFLVFQRLIVDGINTSGIKG